MEGGDHGVGVGDVDPDDLDAGAGRQVVGEPERDLVGVTRHDEAPADRDERQCGGDRGHARGEDECRQRSALEVGQRTLERHPRLGAGPRVQQLPGGGVPVETYVEDSTTGGFTGPPGVRSGRPEVTATVAADSPAGPCPAGTSSGPADGPALVVPRIVGTGAASGLWAVTRVRVVAPGGAPSGGVGGWAVVSPAGVGWGGAASGDVAAARRVLGGRRGAGR